VGKDDGLDVGDKEGGDEGKEAGDDDVGEWEEVGGGDDDDDDGGVDEVVDGDDRVHKVEKTEMSILEDQKRQIFCRHRGSI
jgi:hypothetical protein